MIRPTVVRTSLIIPSGFYLDEGYFELNAAILRNTLFGQSFNPQCSFFLTWIDYN